MGPAEKWVHSQFYSSTRGVPVDILNRMQPLQPEQANFLLNSVFLPALKNENRITRSVIQAIPVEKWDYRPDPIGTSGLDLAWHITAAEMRFMDAVAAGEFTLTGNPRPESVKTPLDLLAW